MNDPITTSACWLDCAACVSFPDVVDEVSVSVDPRLVLTCPDVVVDVSEVVVVVVVDVVEELVDEVVSWVGAGS